MNSSTNFDRIQADIVIESEKAHQGGIRHRTLGGIVSESLMRRFLREYFAKENELHFDQGAIVLHPERLNDLSTNRSGITSSQIDIITYKGKPFFRSIDVVSVLPSQVVNTIEVKKWVSPVVDVPSVNLKVVALREHIPRPTYFVGIRHFGDFESIQRESKTDGTFLFSKQTGGIYPMDVVEDTWLNRGELERLVRAVERDISTYHSGN